MLQPDTRSYGLTTEDALQAFQDGRIEKLNPNNRWKFALVDHSQGLHRQEPVTFGRICLACRLEELWGASRMAR